MAEQTFRDAWLSEADRQRFPRRGFMKLAAGRPALMQRLERHCATEREKDPKKYGSGWSAIIAALLPVLLKLLQEWLDSK